MFVLATTTHMVLPALAMLLSNMSGSWFLSDPTSFSRSHSHLVLFIPPTVNNIHIQHADNAHTPNGTLAHPDDTRHRSFIHTLPPSLHQ